MYSCNAIMVVRGVSYFRTVAGIICPSGAASIRDCHVFVESGMTNPNSKSHSKTFNLLISHHPMVGDCLVNESPNTD